MNVRSHFAFIDRTQAKGHPQAHARTQLEVNLVAPTVVIKAFAPLLGTDRTLTGPPGRIVNSSSVEGRFAPERL